MGDFKVGESVRLRDGERWGGITPGRVYAVVRIDDYGDSRVTNNDGRECDAYSSVFELVTPAAPGADDKALAYLREKLTVGHGMAWNVEVALTDMLREVYGLKVGVVTTLVPVT